MEDDFAKWYTDVVRKAGLIDYSSVRGCMILKPYGYAIWENIQATLDRMFKDTGHQNVYMPMFIPESLLNKEKEHVAGFAPEVAWVTHGGSEKLTERMCVRPTSETLFCEHYAKEIQSYRDLPKLYNQWCSVVRWEKTTRPFLRNCEFLWQEGHTIHETAEEAREETLRMLDVYADLCEKYLAVPVIQGRKTHKEKFAGAEDTYSIEAMMHNGYGLQSATSHYFGDGFAKAFDITFTGRDNVIRHPYQTSWGMTTRIIGAVIMTHGDNSGLVIPPYIAPHQIAVVPIAHHKEGVTEAAVALHEELRQSFRAIIDLSENSAGWKFAQYEMLGVPIRIEIGPKDIENRQCVAVCRATGEKRVLPLAGITQSLSNLLEEIHQAMYTKALANRQERTFTADNLDKMREYSTENLNLFVKAMWCGSSDCEDKVKDQTGLKSLNIPFDSQNQSGACVCCGAKAENTVLWGRSY
ncbi:MAG: proline--tRNA ligase [Oscillospiraceae bacterium]|nr:proline--tRNA ligase [Oscillospiraceae bacterium]